MVNAGASEGQSKTAQHIVEVGTLRQYSNLARLKNAIAGYFTEVQTGCGTRRPFRLRRAAAFETKARQSSNKTHIVTLF